MNNHRRYPRNKLVCNQCGYIHGATTDYAPLKPDEAEFLRSYGFELAVNIHGDEIARPHNRNYFNSARFELHHAKCLRPTAFDRIISNETNFD